MTRHRQSVVLSDLRVTPAADGTEVSVDLAIGDTSARWYYRTTATGVAETMDPFVGAVLGTAMKVGGPLIVRGPVTDAFVDRCADIQRVWEIWMEDPYRPDWRDFHRVELLADERAEPTPTGPHSATFFSGGIDSWDHLLRFRDELDTLVFIHDWEGRFPAAARTDVAANAQSVADHYGMAMIRTETNAKELLTPYVSWRMLGGFLPAFAVLHAPSCGVVHLPSNYDISGLEPWGSHPLLDPRYGVNGQVLVYGPNDRTRLEKTEQVAASPFALEHLRVCWQPMVNCGYCSKCIRTRLSLQVVGGLDRARLIPGGPVTREEIVSAMHANPEANRFFAEAAYRLVAEDREPEIVAAVEEGRLPVPEPVSRAHALSVLAPETVRRGVRRLRGTGTSR